MCGHLKVSYLVFVGFAT